MSTTDPFDRRDSLDRTDGRPVKEGSGCLKWFLILSAIGGVCLLLCCGVAGFVGYRMKPTVVTQPAEVVALAQEITDIAIPEDLVGKTGVKMNMLGIMSMTMCQFEQAEGRGSMQMMEMKINMGDQQAGDAALKQQMAAQGTPEMRQLNIEKSETRETTVRGEPAKFTIAEGKDVSTSTIYHELKGEFKGKNGVAKLHLQLEDEVWDAEEIDALIESIK